jgi:hypothetical protein
VWITSGHRGRNNEGQRLSLRQLIVVAVAVVSADAAPRRRACLSMSGRDSLNTIGHAAVVGGSGIHRPLFQWDLPQSMLQNESRGYAIALTRVLAGCKLRFVTCLDAINSGFWTSLGELRKSIEKRQRI